MQECVKDGKITIKSREFVIHLLLTMLKITKTITWLISQDCQQLLLLFSAWLFDIVY